MPETLSRQRNKARPSAALQRAQTGEAIGDGAGLWSACGALCGAGACSGNLARNKGGKGWNGNGNRRQGGHGYGEQRSCLENTAHSIFSIGGKSRLRTGRYRITEPPACRAFRLRVRLPAPGWSSSLLSQIWF